MIALTTSAVNLLNLYAWEILKKNTDMDASDYGGKIPIIPGGGDPDLNAYDKPFIVYGAAEDPSSSNGTVRGGTLVYAVYSTSVGEINKIMNIICTAFEERDVSARRINAWTSKNPAFVGIRFTSTNVAFGEAASPADQEGGREVGTLTLRYSCVTNYVVDLNV